MDFHLYSVVISLKVRFFLTFYQKPHVNFAPRLAKSLSENFVKNFLYGRTVFLLSESSCSDSAAYAGFSPLRVESFIMLTESFKMMWESRVWRFCAFHTVDSHIIRKLSVSTVKPPALTAEHPANVARSEQKDF